MAQKRVHNKHTHHKLKKCKSEKIESNTDDNTTVKTEHLYLLNKFKIKEEPNELENDAKETKYSKNTLSSVCSGILTVKETDIHNMAWRKLSCNSTQLRLDIVLKCGQSFRWSTPFKNRPQEYVGVLGSKVWILKQEPEHILYKTLSKSAVKQEPTSSFKSPVGEQDQNDEKYLRDYFQLDVDLESLYESWKNVDPVFNDISQRFTGVRMLRQDPVENIFSFICSSNNNIQRISGMIDNLCIRYGQEITRIASEEGLDSETKVYYTFPTLESLCAEPQQGIDSMNVEQTLRSLSFGYRAAYIAKTAKQILASGGYEYLLSLRLLPYDKAKTELLKLTGIGPKVADCILLMSLDKPSSIPVDTHMFQIAAKKYLPHLRERKSVTDKVYTEISDHFRGLYGDYAGWAHSVLFSADLRHLQNIEHPSDGQTKHTKTVKRNNSKKKK